MTTVQELIQLNNTKRSQLTRENLKYYEEMLLYIRFASGRSEQQTEELLLELLEHVLQAQQEGRTAEQVFGDEPKAYCEELIGEIPGETRKNQLLISARITLLFLAVSSFFSGIAGAGMYYLFHIGSGQTNFHIGSALIVVSMDVLLLYLFIMTVLRWVKASTFKKAKPKKGLEVLQFAGISTLSVGLFVAVLIITPDLGPAASIPTLYLAGIGIVLYMISLLFKNREISR
ncbi:DUF1129 family protein [Paenibacillus albidus]|uniref:DUF1129 family protein n=1 Tax=Paenibacillus albidus TaxID=2041023 RepID=UPI001BE6B4CF|nr:DUF1129 family protein [Paenibacillus albidus]MBT2287868.1 DUF1129 family protein [Paenibacillus albidus]